MVSRTRKRKPRAAQPAPNGADDEVHDQEGGENGHEEQESSPVAAEDACVECGKKDLDNEDSEKTQWIACGACKRWYQWKCTPSSSETISVDAVDKW